MLAIASCPAFGCDLKRGDEVQARQDQNQLEDKTRPIVEFLIRLFEPRDFFLSALTPRLDFLLAGIDGVRQCHTRG